MACPRLNRALGIPAGAGVEWKARADGVGVGLGLELGLANGGGTCRLSTLQPAACSLQPPPRAHATTAPSPHADPSPYMAGALP
jgi:hypothetical protein